jgi:4-amino-4-deoxy-L-arabinose transferase-like glycosyltransferase
VQSLRRTQLLLVAITAAALAPFLNKAFHIDDPLFIWMAQQIAKHPFDPYGFYVNWVSFRQPITIVMQNPPLCPYYIAAVASVFGWTELTLHLAFLFWATLSILGTFAFARRFCRKPLIAAMLTLFTPLFLVSATSTMCDVMMLAFWIWALEFWFAGLDRQESWRFLVSAALISAAALTKYFGISLVPLLAAYTLARDRRLAAHLAFLLLPIVALFTYDLVTEGKYGYGLFSAAMSVSSSISSATRPSHFVQMLMGLAFSGGCFVSALFFAPFRGRRLFLAAAISFGAFAAAFKFLICSWIYLETAEAAVWLEGGFFATIGAGILALAVINMLHQKSADSLLLLLWIVGTFCFATFFNWSITARTFLPMAPAVAILTIQHFERLKKRSRLEYLPLLGAAGLSILIGVADYRQANCARDAAWLYQKRYGAEASKVQFLGHWGFQYYMEQWGAKAFDRNNPKVAHGEIVVGPFSDPNVVHVSVEKVFTRDESTFSTLPFISTFRVGTGAGFYSSFGGPLPWVINKIPPERYYAVETR